MTGGHLQRVAQIAANCPTKGNTHVTLGRSKAGRTSTIWRNQRGQSLSEDDAWTVSGRTKALANLEVQLHLNIRPRQIGNGTRILAMHTRCRRETNGTV